MFIYSGCLSDMNPKESIDANILPGKESSDDDGSTFDVVQNIILPNDGYELKDPPPPWQFIYVPKHDRNAPNEKEPASHLMNIPLDIVPNDK